MSAIPVGYDSIQGLRRKGVSLLCILLASAMAMGIFVYVDSYSIHEWNDSVGNLGSVAMSVNGDNVGSYLDEILEIPEVVKAARIHYSYASVARLNTLYEEYWGQTIWFTEEYTEAFPDRYELIEGEYPSNETEICLTLAVSNQLDVDIGDQVNYTMYWEYPNEEFAILDVVGLFHVEVNEEQWWRPTEIGIVVPELMNPYEDDIVISVEIDRTPLNPFNAGGSLSHVQNIEQSIRALDPSYGPPYYNSELYVENFIAGAISDYIMWQMNTRLTQIVRSAGTLLLVGLVMFLAIRHNMNERRYENNMLMSRGASRGDVEKRVLKEIFILSVIGTVSGLFVGILFSRIGLAATGYFEFDILLFFSEPFLVSLESIIIAVIIGMVLPIGSWFAYNGFYSTRRRVETSTGKLEKASRVLSFIRWDVLLLLLSTFLLIGLLSTGELLQYNPLLSMIASFLPFVMFVSIGSLTIKTIRGGANLMSRGMKSIIGVLPSSIGVRRLGKSASSAGPAVLVLVLSISIAWTYSVVGASMPLTKQNQGRFAFGGDVAFNLGYGPDPLWANFTANVTQHQSTSQTSLIHKMDVLLSTDYYDHANLVGMNPEEYKMVGYDYWGNQLNDSELGPMMDALATTAAGVIITTDLADTYDLSVGDTVRTFSQNFFENDEVFVFTVVGIVNALSNSEVSDTGTPQPNQDTQYVEPIGSQTLWVNKDYLGTLVSLTNDTQNVLCVRTNPGTNGTVMVEDIMNNGGDQVVYEDNWACVTYEVDSYIFSVTYRIDRSVDTLLSVASSAIILAAFIIYAFEGLNARKREIALIRSMGGEKSLIVKAQVAEMIILVLFALVLLTFYGPLHITNALINYQSSYYVYPVSVFPIFPISTMAMVLAFFIASTVIFVVAVASLSARVKLSESLNATWAESGPYGGDV